MGDSEKDLSTAAVRDDPVREDALCRRRRRRIEGRRGKGGNSFYVA